MKLELERAYSFRVQSGKITVWDVLAIIGWKVQGLRMGLKVQDWNVLQPDGSINLALISDW